MTTMMLVLLLPTRTARPCCSMVLPMLPIVLVLRTLSGVPAECTLLLFVKKTRSSTATCASSSIYESVVAATVGSSAWVVAIDVSHAAVIQTPWVRSQHMLSGEFFRLSLFGFFCLFLLLCLCFFRSAFLLFSLLYFIFVPSLFSILLP